MPTSRSNTIQIITLPFTTRFSVFNCISVVVLVMFLFESCSTSILQRRYLPGMYVDKSPAPLSDIRQTRTSTPYSEGLADISVSRKKDTSQLENQNFPEQRNGSSCLKPVEVSRRKEATFPLKGREQAGSWMNKGLLKDSLAPPRLYKFRQKLEGVIKREDDNGVGTWATLSCAFGGAAMALFIGSLLLIYFGLGSFSSNAWNTLIQILFILLLVIVLWFCAFILAILALIFGGISLFRSVKDKKVPLARAFIGLTLGGILALAGLRFIWFQYQHQ